MLFIKLTPVLYTLKDFRAYVLKKPTTKSNITLLANNTIVFNLTKTEIANVEKFQTIKQYNSLILSYNKINYIDDQYQHLIKQYPSLKTLNTTYCNLFEQFFNLIQKANLMKYVWASWSVTPLQLSAGEKTNEVKTRHIRGYGCAVTFSSTNVIWSSSHTTYSLRGRGFQTSFSHG